MDHAMDDRKKAKTRSAPVDVFGADRFTQDWGWERACVAFALSLFPGCAHLYVGLPRHAAAWSLIYLFVFIPAALAGYVLWSSTEAVYAGLVTAFGLFVLAGAVGPTLLALRGPRGTIARAEAGPSPSLHVLGTYAFLIHLGGCVEVAYFRQQCFTSVEMRGDCTVPLLEPGQLVRVLVSSYVRPVHGEIVLVALPNFPARRGSSAELGRVLAKPHDTVAWSDGVLVVNGQELDCTTRFPRKLLEQRGRRARRLRLFGGPAAISESEKVRAQNKEAWLTVDWSGDAAGPWLIRGGEYLILPPLCAAQGGTSGQGTQPTAAWLVPETWVRGRAVY
jgi:hypothetical protein